MNDHLGYYKILEISPSSSQDEIKSAYRRMAKKHHPDLKKDGSDAEFKKIQEAYDILSDDKKRRIYDSGQSSFNTNGYDINDFFHSVMKKKTSYGIDLSVVLEITLEEAKSGIVKTISVCSNKKCSSCNGSKCKAGKSPLICSACSGSGICYRTQNSGFTFIHSAENCKKCNGSGKVFSKEDTCEQCKGSGLEDEVRNIVFSVPKEAIHGMQFLRKGDGSYSDPEGEKGSLIVTIVYTSHPVFRVDFNSGNIVLDLRITFTQAMTGCDIIIPTLNGSKNLKIPAGVENGKLFYLKDCGITRSRHFSVLIVQVLYEVPKIDNFPEEEKNKIIETLKLLEDESSIPEYYKNKSIIEEYVNSCNV